MVHLVLGTSQADLQGPGARIVVGRDPGVAPLSHSDPTLSRRHAELFLDGGQLYIHDLGSANGVWIDGAHIGLDPVPVRPGQQVWLGHVPLGVTWPDAAGGGATVMAREVPPELKVLIAQHQQAQVAAAAAPLAAGADHPPAPSEFAYRRQGNNSNGVLLIALKQDTFFNGVDIQGYIEFTSLDNQTVASIGVELRELHRRGDSKGHIWDRVQVRQGPWRAQHNDVLPLPFTLRVPPGTAMSDPDVTWELRGTVDINWASDIHLDVPITMRNQDIERLRDGLGAMDYRVMDIQSEALGQRYVATFGPPAQLARDWGINHVSLAIEYLGSTLKVRMTVERKGFHSDKALDQVFELTRLRTASQQEIDATLAAMLHQLMPAK
ncbi:MAG TPA: FHA domain-containing protein [Kofleriaceae bacterium]|jgi:hypothetical protein